jgi:hypothetical protein
VEYAGANLFLQSENISSASWLDQNGASRLQVSVTNPIGGTTCTQVTSAGANNAISQGPTYQAGMPHVIRIWVRAGTSSQLQIGVYTGGFVTGSISVISGTATVSGTGLFLATGLTSTWTQLQIVYTSLTGSGAFLIYPDTAAAVAGKTIYVWGAQINPGSTAQTYYPTTTAAYYAPRFDYSPTTIGEPRGLLVEGQTTNITLYSEKLNQSVVNVPWYYANLNTPTAATGIADPYGNTTGTTAWKLVATGTGYHAARQTWTFTAAAYTFSFYAKAAEYDRVTIGDLTSGQGGCSFVLTGNGTTTVRTGGTGSPRDPQITPYPNGWYRCSYTMTMTATAAGMSIVGYPAATTPDAYGASYTADGTSGVYVTMVQVELGSGASSYIPTGASGVTRNAELCSMTGTNFSSWWNQTEGTAFIETVGMTKPTDLTYRAFTISQFNAVPYQIGATWIYDNSGFRITELASSATKHAVALKANDFAISNGTSTIRTGTGAFGSTYDRLTLGSYENTTAHMNGCIKRFKYYPTRLSNAELQTLTAP